MTTTAGLPLRRDQTARDQRADPEERTKAQRRDDPTEQHHRITRRESGHHALDDEQRPQADQDFLTARPSRRLAQRDCDTQRVPGDHPAHCRLGHRETPGERGTVVSQQLPDPQVMRPEMYSGASVRMRRSGMSPARAWTASSVPEVAARSEEFMQELQPLGGDVTDARIGTQVRKGRGDLVDGNGGHDAVNVTSVLVGRPVGPLLCVADTFIELERLCDEQRGRASDIGFYVAGVPCREAGQCHEGTVDGGDFKAGHLLGGPGVVGRQFGAPFRVRLRGQLVRAQEVHFGTVSVPTCSGRSRRPDCWSLRVKPALRMACSSSGRSPSRRLAGPAVVGDVAHRPDPAEGLRAGGQLGLRRQQLDAAAGDVDADLVAVLDQGDHSARRRVRRDVAVAEAGAPARRPAGG